MISETINYTLTLYLIFDLGNKKTNNWYNMRIPRYLKLDGEGCVIDYLCLMILPHFWILEKI